MAAGVAGCVRLNPGFGDGGGTGTGGASGGSTAVDPADPVTTTEPNGTGSMSGSGSSSDAGSTGQTPGDYLCGTDQIDILISPQPSGCLAFGGGMVEPVTIEAECMSVHNVDGVLHAAFTSGTALRCLPLGRAKNGA